jgi:hypothetical protein
MSKLSCTADQINTLYTEWQKRKHPGLRWGQLVCNKYLLGPEGWRELYYVEDSNAAWDLIMADLYGPSN